MCTLTEAVQTSEGFLTRSGSDISFSGSLLVDRDPTCQPVSPVTLTTDLVVRANLGVNADFASVEVVVDATDEQYEGIVEVYSNIDSLYDGKFRGLFEYCLYRGKRRSGHVTHTKLYYYCDCVRSQCQYVYFKVKKGDYSLELCEIHVYPNQNYTFTN